VAVAKTYHDLGLLHKKSKNLAEAESAFLEALSRQEQVCRAHPGVSRYAIDRATTLLNLGHLAVDRGRLAAALNEFEQALQILEMVLADEPTHRDARMFRDEARASKIKTVGMIIRL